MSIDRYESTFVVSPDPSKGDFTSLQPAIDALPASGGKIFVKAGVYPPITNTIRITTSNVHIQGEGMGITVFVADASMTGNTPALEAFSTASDGTPRALVADTARGDLTIQVSPADAASFAAGDYVLLFSNKSVDTEVPTKHAGEVKQLVAVDPTAGALTMDDQIFDAYTQADAAKVVRITMLQNITLSDCSITTLAPFSNLRAGFTHFRFVENLQIDRVEVHHAYYTGIQVQSVRNSAMSGCFIHHISDIVPINPPNPANERYGMTVGGASQNVSISGCRFSHTRHAVTTGGSSGTNQNGVQRNIVVAHCTSMLSDTGHFDTHQPAENVTFIGCVADGGVPAAPATSGAYGFQMRGRNCSIIGCSVLQAVGRGIMIFGPVSSGAVISGNMIANVTAIVGNRAGTGIYFDSAGTSNHAVTGNVIKNCAGSAVANGGSNNDIVITGNIIENVSSVVPGAAIQLTNASRVLISGNNIGASLLGPAIAMRGTSDDWRIAGNHLGGGVALAGVGSVVVDNFGYNPVGGISNPWPSTGTDLTNTVASGSGAPTSGTVYTIRHTPKTIVVTGGDVSQIMINGADAGSTAGTFKLGVGETIAMIYNASAPVTLVFAE
ncbi:MAG TPA: right-handed parallel beta-helix repeat-containing protein [bacterium]|nr:right-handed parallel beta-helix repeat-containing protein [bacterium]